MHTRQTGSAGEDDAVVYLQSLGWKILERNAHFRFGEVDILADAGDMTAVVEVKIKRHAAQGMAVEMITPAKKRTLLQLAKFVEARYNKPVRVDVITIDAWGSNQAQLHHYPFAIGEI